MKKNRLSRFIILLATAILTFLILIFFMFRNSSLISTISGPVTSVVSKVDYVISSPFRLASDVANGVQDLFQTYSENQSLKKSLSEVENQESTIESLKNENEALRASLQISESFSGATTLTAKVIVRSPVSWLNKVTVNIGKKDNVTKNMLAVSDGGLVGIVSSVSNSTATVSLITNTDDSIEIPVKISTSSGDIYGILSGYDDDKNLLKITQLNSSSDISSGDQVVSSGLDGETVANVPVGTVSSVDSSSNSLSRVVYVSPTADVESLSYITLIGQ